MSYKEKIGELLEGLDTRTKRHMSILIENTIKEMNNKPSALTEAASAGSTASGNIAVLNQVMLPVIRRVMPTVIANDIVGVQPMTGPVGQIHTLRFRYSNNVGNTVAGDEAMSPFDISRYYSGNQDPNNPAAAPTAALEGTGGPEMDLQLLKETVEAKTRKLQASWTFEADQDANTQHGISIEEEMISILSQEIAQEIDQEILYRLRALPSGPSATYDQANVSGTPNSVVDQHAALMVLINREANMIAKKTRRARANWLVASTDIITLFESASASAFVRTTEGTMDSPDNQKLVGKLNGNLRVYSDTYAQSGTPILLGLKGSDTEAAMFYCPYVPLLSSGVIIDPTTFQPKVSFLTRYGLVALTNKANTLGNAADYLSLIDVANLSFY